jgi:CBS-domain-containing membrane protein
MIKLKRFAGAGGSRPPHLGLRAIALGGVGGFLGIGALALLGGSVGVLLLLGSFGASVHPPAGSNPVIIFLGHPGWGFILFPVLCGAVLLVLIALLYNNVVRKTPYPILLVASPPKSSEARSVGGGTALWCSIGQ